MLTHDLDGNFKRVKSYSHAYVYFLFAKNSLLGYPGE